MKVIIVGGGIGGLSAAIGLGRAGHKVKVSTVLSLAGQTTATAPRSIAKRSTAIDIRAVRIQSRSRRRHQRLPECIARPPAMGL